ncbi:MAG: ribonuclease H-like domain-containing protein [Polyangiaceae bacterium]
MHKKRVGSVTLKRLESEVLGLERGPDIDGAEIGPRYAHFLRSGDESALAVVVEHNAIDVLSMLALVGLYGEPLELLDPMDLVQLGQSFVRGKAHERAEAVAALARSRGAGSEALRLTARVAKARGDKMRALLHFEELARELSDDSVRLELAKLYEHVVRDPQKALEVASQGTGESEEAQAKRRTRLERKIGK